MKVIRTSVFASVAAFLSVAALLLLIPSQDLFADNVTWTTWTMQSGVDSQTCVGPATVDGTAGSEAVTYSGDTCGFQSAMWTPSSTYADGTIVTNGPPQPSGMIKLYGGTTNTNTVTFSSPVTNPLFAILSLGSATVTAMYDFIQTPTFVVGGPSDDITGGGSISVLGNMVTGANGSGTVEFLGTFDSISFINPVFENFSGITVGIPDAVVTTPEPASFLTLAAALLGLGLVRRKMGGQAR